jgi:hypothetical protein
MIGKRFPSSYYIFNYKEIWQLTLLSNKMYLAWNIMLCNFITLYHNLNNRELYKFF